RAGSGRRWIVTFFFGDYSFPSAFARMTDSGRASSLYLTPAQFAQAHDEKQQFLTSDSNCSSD
ncbi:hypothetical protein, partial [Burkholderia ubonensis]|uniref:hypothetical protein n=1 Tax=Burkholderia ubonensis TaxID=101571 RepID=UPI001E414735